MINNRVHPHRESVLALVRLEHSFWKRSRPQEEYPSGDQFWWRSTTRYEGVSEVIAEIAATGLDDARDFQLPMKHLKREYTRCAKKLARARGIYIETDEALRFAVDLISGHFTRRETTFGAPETTTRSYMKNPELEYIPCESLVHQFADFLRADGYQQILSEEEDEEDAEWIAEPPMDPLTQALLMTAASTERPKWEAMFTCALKQLNSRYRGLIDTYGAWAYGGQEDEQAAKGEEDAPRPADAIRDARERFLSLFTRSWCGNRKPCDLARAILSLQENQPLTPWMRYLDRSSRRVWEDKLQAVKGELVMVRDTGQTVKSPCARVINYACKAPLCLPPKPPDCGPAPKLRGRPN